ncbi:OmcA/MtrC family decaheme c-type cytochrome [Shewanella sp. NIFS-20-20]|uniref:OmcA/MtrC family decaheme c-type cytochrome n=1 Tax=Shewanella sp. NIFS-20-20 TaxID=2853806 RepID=UPI001C445FD1|nr:OmcA/MtrC family decaheme c-type cytochrome [Shewanella sp. NIFS-20-20]MBV7316561.1 OmcA/MtrC family decaheme c-type cytochrome [Shewanella sp. NIFS-20-20]
MMNTQLKKIALLLATGALTVGLAGCGSDGDNGTPGKPGGPAADAVAQLHLDITGLAHADGQSVVTVFATNEADLPVVGLKEFEIKKAAQLLPQGATGAGNAGQWQIIGSQKQFIDNKDGSYTFTLETEGYNPELTQRFNFIAAASTLQDGVTTVPRTEYTEDLASDGSEAKFTKNVVASETCNTCHTDTKKIYHGYTDLDTCITCHNDELAASRGTEAGFNHLIHNVHNMAKPWGKDDAKDAATANAIVQDNCQACHIQPADDNHELAEWGNWSRVPTMETCSSCHTNIDFVSGQGHPAQADNSNCIACHNASWTEEIHLSKSQDKQAFINSYGLDSSLTVSADNIATISVGIVDAAGNSVDLQKMIGQIQQLETITNVGPNHPIMGFKPATEVDHQKVTLNLVKNGQLQADVEVIDNRLVASTPALPVTATGADTDTAFTFIGLGICNDGQHAITCADGTNYTGMKADLVFATKTEKAPTMRHIDSVNYDSCADCHADSFEIHKGYHPGFVMSEQLARIVDGQEVVGVDGCVSCHTPTGTGYSGNGMDLGMRTHQTHGAFYGLIGGDCAQCHNDFNLDSFKVKGAQATEAGYTTPITATCTSCHSGDYLGHSQADLVNFGAVFNGSFAEANDAAIAGTETCLFCHKPTVANHGAVQM